MTPPNTVNAERLRALRAQRVLRDMRGRYERLKAGDAVEALDAAIEALAARAEPQGKAERGEVPSYLLACTCPSGDGSLRWPCPKHPPAGEDTAAAQIAERLEKALEGIAARIYPTSDLHSLLRECLAALAQRPAAHNGWIIHRLKMLTPFAFDQRVIDEAVAALATAQPATPREHPAAQGDAETVREALRMLWMLVQSNGGKLTVTPDAILSFDAKRAAVERLDNMDGSIIFTAVTHPQGEHKESQV